MNSNSSQRNIARAYHENTEKLQAQTEELLQKHREPPAQPIGVSHLRGQQAVDRRPNRTSISGLQNLMIKSGPGAPADRVAAPVRVDGFIGAGLARHMLTSDGRGTNYVSAHKTSTDFMPRKDEKASILLPDIAQAARTPAKGTGQRGAQSEQPYRAGKQSIMSSDSAVRGSAKRG